MSSLIKCPNCDIETTIDGECEECGNGFSGDLPKPEEITITPICQADNCKRDSDGINIVVNGQKREVCDCCAETHYEDLAHSNADKYTAIDEERGEGRV